MATSTKTRLTGERPQQGVTPDSLLALHEAGYRAVLDRIGDGRILDVGCGQGFESARFLGRRAARWSGSTTPPRPSPRPPPATAPRASGWRRWTPLGLGFLPASFDGACSSHLIEHFTDPEPHVAELARVLKDDGVVCVLTPNKPADFENPFHLHLFDRDELRAMLERHFGEVWLGGVDAAPHVKADFAARRVKANKLLAARRVRPPPPHAARVVRLGLHAPAAAGLQAGGPGRHRRRHRHHGRRLVRHRELDDTTLVLFAVARRPAPGPALA